MPRGHVGAASGIRQTVVQAFFALIGFLGLFLLARSLWGLVLAVRYRRWVEQRVRILRFNPAGWTATVEPERPGPLLDVPWIIGNGRQPVLGTRVSVIHPPGEPDRLQPGMGWRGWLGAAWKAFLVGVALLAAARVLSLWT